MNTPSILITGGGHGLGLAVARAFADAGWSVIVLDRVPLAPGDAAALGPALLQLPYDPLDDRSASEAVERLGGRPVEVALLCADRPGDPDLPPEAVGRREWEDVVVGNAYAPLRLAALLEPNLRAGQRKVLAALSSRTASMGLGEGTRDFALRASKAAFNQLWRTLSVEWKDWGCICLLLEPRPAEDPAAAAADLRRLLEGATPDLSGRHITRDGNTVPW